MKIFILVLVMMTLTDYASSQFFLTEILNNNVRLTVNPPYFVEGVKSQVDIVCTFKRDNVPSMASVFTMVIGHSNKTDQPVFNYLASVNGMESHAHNVSHDVEVISGSIDNNGESKLHMRFMYPETHLIGLYMCEVTGFDQIGKPVSIYSTVKIVTYNITELVDALHNAQSNITESVDALQKAKSNITDLVEALHNAKSNITDLVDALHSAQLIITDLTGTLLKAQESSAMQACQSNYTESMHTLHSTLCTNYYPPLFYNGHVYYLSHMFNYFNRTEMQTTCEVLGGYLVEIDSHDEFNFIRDFLVKQGHVVAVWTGATDEKQEGVWINEHNLTSIPSFDWGSNKPLGGRAWNCQCFHDSVNLFLSECYCYFKGIYNNQYICEVPGIKC